MKSKIKVTQYRTVVIPILVSFVLFFIVGDAVLKGIENHFIQYMRELSINLGRGYSYSIEKSLGAEAIFESLIEDKLLTASETTGNYTNFTDREALIDYALALRVDEINLYDSQGNLLMSTDPNFTNWKAFQGHPIYGFIQSSDRTMVEPIRENVVTKERYKYGYYKLIQGNIVQIGLKADRIEEVTGSLNPSRALNDILNNNSNIQAACYIPSSSTNTTCVNESDDFDVDTLVFDLLYVNSSQVDGYVSKFDSSVYVLYVPVMVQNQRVGTLYLHHYMSDQNLALREFTNLGVSVLAIVYALIAYIFILNTHKNKQLGVVAYMDELTQLPNASYLQNSFEKFASHHIEGKAVVLVNIEDFRTINKAYGYQGGDDVLKEVSSRLRRLSDQHHQLFRWEGDRFIFLVDEVKRKEDLMKFNQRIIQQFNDAFSIENIKKNIRVRLSMVKLTRKITLSQAVQKALITLDYGPSIDNSIVEFDDNIAQTMRRELTIVDELQDIIEGNQPQRLFMVFQPIFDTNTQKVTSVEALARFNSFTLGSVNPNEFIEIAEKHHLIYELGKIIFKQSLDFVAQLKSMGNDSIRVAVNVSGIQLVHDHFVEDVLSMLNEFGLNGHHCEIEITESVLMQDLQRVNGILEQLQSHGIVISIDDFGTGYSSFFTLSELNVNILKINRSFVRQIYHAENDQKIIAREIIQMAHKLGLKIVAEEVEYEKEYLYLLLNRCDYIQGYFYSRPLIPQMCIEFLNNKKMI